MGIWLIKYGLQTSAEAKYLEWFHDVHIAEKLARPGYDWAAHYRIDNSTSETGQYIALFGGSSSRPFYDPSPAQIKPHQSTLTREMMGYRVAPHMQILTQEWSQSEGSETQSDAIHSPFLTLWMFQPHKQNGQEAAADPLQDQMICAWCAQEFFSKVLRQETCDTLHKLLASTGMPRHLVIQECNDDYGNTESGSEAIQENWKSKNSGVELTKISASRCWPLA